MYIAAYDRVPSELAIILSGASAEQNSCLSIQTDASSRAPENSAEIDRKML
jgi:hypothetical protein